MFYEPAKGHGLPHDPFKALVAPRPIGWISCRGADGSLNLSPYSYFNAISARPYLVGFSSEGEKDALTFIRETGEFVANLATRDLAEKVVATSVDAPRGTSEFEYAGLTPAPSRIVSAPRVAEAHAALECKLTDICEPRTVDGSHAGVWLVIGEVVGIHIDEAMLTDGLFDAVKAGNLARLGYFDYSTVDAVFPLRRPKWEGA